MYKNKISLDHTWSINHFTAGHGAVDVYQAYFNRRHRRLYGKHYDGYEGNAAIWGSEGESLAVG